jgi:hypothetical protein
LGIGLAGLHSIAAAGDLNIGGFFSTSGDDGGGGL